MKLAPECRDCLLTKVRSQVSAVISDEKNIDRIVERCAEIFDAGFLKMPGRLSLPERFTGSAILRWTIKTCMPGLRFAIMSVPGMFLMK
ncbi:MAG TPA: hypothetical protein O0W97_07920 [Methanocorpusculum sp.]|nr:hypothetical protein [Methanocorpusculum sp.]